MNKLVGIYLFLGVFILSFSNCSDNDAMKLEVDKPEVVLSVDNPQVEFNIIANSEWSINSPGLQLAFGPNTGSTEWYTITPVVGEGNAKITIEAKGESATNEVVLAIKSGSVYKQVVLKRK